MITLLDPFSFPIALARGRMSVGKGRLPSEEAGEGRGMGGEGHQAVDGDVGGLANLAWELKGGLPWRQGGGGEQWAGEGRGRGGGGGLRRWTAGGTELKMNIGENNGTESEL